MIDPSPFPMNRSFTRWWTAREYARNPTSLEAYVAAEIAWGVGRVARPEGTTDLDVAMARAGAGRREVLP